VNSPGYSRCRRARKPGDVLGRQWVLWLSMVPPWYLRCFENLTDVLGHRWETRAQQVSYDTGGTAWCLGRGNVTLPFRRRDERNQTSGLKGAGGADKTEAQATVPTVEEEPKASPGAGCPGFVPKTLRGL